MKASFLLLSFNLILFSCPLIAQNLKYDFENWLEFELYKEPEVYETSNFQSFFSALAPNVTKVPGVNGSAIRLENKAVLFDTTVIPGLLYFGDLANFPAGGLPYPYTVPDSLILTAKYNIQPGDSGLVLLLFKRFGFPVSVNVFPVTGNSGGFQRYSLPLTPSGIAPDSVVLLISSGNLNNPLEGSFMEIDEMRFSNTVRQLPNFDLEAWETIQFEEPEGWTGANLISSILRVPKAIEKSTDASEGSYALSLTQRSINKLGIQENIGLCFMGEAASGSPTGAAFPSYLFKVSLDYKYAPNGLDTAWMLVMASRYDAARSTTDTLKIMELPLVQTGSYRSVEMIVPLSDLSDTVLLALFPSNDFPGKSIPGTLRDGSRLWVDNIRVDQISATNNAGALAFEISPNPASQDIWVKDLIPGSRLVVYAADGRRMMEARATTDNLHLGLESFAPGSYYMMVTDQNKTGIKPFIIQK